MSNSHIIKKIKDRICKYNKKIYTYIYIYIDIEKKIYIYINIEVINVRISKTYQKQIIYHVC